MSTEEQGAFITKVKDVQEMIDVHGQENVEAIKKSLIDAYGFFIDEAIKAMKFRKTKPV